LGALLTRGGRTIVFGEQRLKFKIYADGRVEETVTGVLGDECLKITEELNEKLGKVIVQKDTEEMLQEVVVKNTVYESTKAEW